MQVEQLYFRGMNGDKDRPPVSVTDSRGEITSDADFLECKL